MRHSYIKSYYKIAEEEGNEAAHDLCCQDGEWIDDNFPQLTRSFQVIHQRLDNAEKLMESVREAISQLTATLQIISISIGEHRNETKH